MGEALQKRKGMVAPGGGVQQASRWKLVPSFFLMQKEFSLRKLLE